MPITTISSREFNQGAREAKRAANKGPLPVDTAVAQRCARRHVPGKCGERAALIAATARVHGMAMVTRNVADRMTSCALANPVNQ